MYEESLRIKEGLGDLKGKGATLHQMASVYVTRGALDEALGLYEESLRITEGLGDLQGKGATLSMMANVAMQQADWAQAERLVQAALTIAQQLNLPADMAYRTVKLGQVAQARGDLAKARQHYQTGLAHFEQLGMPEAAQVRAMLASLDQGPGDTAEAGAGTKPAGQSEPEALIRLTQAAAQAVAGETDRAKFGLLPAELKGRLPLSPAGEAYLAVLETVLEGGRGAEPGYSPAALAEAGLAYLAPLAPDWGAAFGRPLARLCDLLQDPAAAVRVQAVAIERMRLDTSPQGGEALSVALFNYAGYLAQIGDWPAAIAAAEEVVTLDEQFGLPDLASDRDFLASLRQQAASAPAGTASEAPPAGMTAVDDVLAALEAQLPDMPPAQQAQMRQFLADVAQRSPAEQAAALNRLAQAQREAQADAVVEAARAARQQGTVADLIPQLEAAAAEWASGEAPGSPYADLAQFVRAVSATLQGHPPEPVAPAYVARLASLGSD